MVFATWKAYAPEQGIDFNNFNSDHQEINEQWLDDLHPSFKGIHSLRSQITLFKERLHGVSKMTETVCFGNYYGSRAMHISFSKFKAKEINSLYLM